MADPYYRYAAPPERVLRVGMRKFISNKSWQNLVESNVAYYWSECMITVANLKDTPIPIGDLRWHTCTLHMQYTDKLFPITSVDPRAALPGYVPSDSSTLTSHHMWSTINPQGSSSEFLRNDILPLRPGGYGLDDLSGLRSRVTPELGGLAPGARAYTPLEDPALLRRDIPIGVKPGTLEIERANPLRKSEGLSANESNILYVDGLPNNCTRREVAHLFRPFIGFKEIQVLHKEPRRSGDKEHVLCFVEFDDSQCALTAMEALQGYRFDEKKPDAPVLRMRFAKFPFIPDDRRPSNPQTHELWRP